MARDSRLLNLRNVALAFWIACALLIAVPAFVGSSSSTGSVPFQRPVGPPGPHPATPVKD